MPITRTYAELGFPGLGDPYDPNSIQTGSEWFAGLSATRQRNMMGHAAYEAWQDGAIELSQLSAIRNNKIYGPMRVEASLVSILGPGASKYYSGAAQGF